MHDPKLFSTKSPLPYLLAALFGATLGALPAPAEPFVYVKSELTLKLNMQACPVQVQVPITVELRSGTSPYTLVESATGIGGGNKASVISFENAADGVPYYVVVKSANSLETWSATSITFNAHGASYDFTTAISQAYGKNQVLSENIPSIYRGDVNQDGLIDLSDIIAVYNDAAQFATGSRPTDINGDGIVDLSDTIVVYNNSQSFVRAISPLKP